MNFDMSNYVEVSWSWSCRLDLRLPLDGDYHQENASIFRIYQIDRLSNKRGDMFLSRAYQANICLRRLEAPTYDFPLCSEPGTEETKDTDD